jgi:hypothetical protein
LDTLKENMVTKAILVFPDWEKTFHVHVDASTIVLGEIMVHPREGVMQEHHHLTKRASTSSRDQLDKPTQIFEMLWDCSASL